MFHQEISVCFQTWYLGGGRGRYCLVLVTHMRKIYETVKLIHTLPASLGKEECIYLYVPFRKLYLKAILGLQIEVFKWQH